MIIMFILISTLFAQGLNIKEDFYSLIYKEINTIKSNKISEDIYIYPTKESMGKLKFEIYDVKLTSEKTAILNGKWELIRINDHPQGNFWLDLEKFENNWLIVKDSTTSF